MVGRHLILPVVVIALSIVSLGCTTNVKKVVHKTSAGVKADQVLLVEPKGPCLVSLSSLGYDGTALAMSMHQANMNAALTNPQYDPAVGLVGVIVGGAIVKDIEKSRAQEKANGPVQGWLTVLDNTNWESAYNRVKKSYGLPVSFGKPGSDKLKGNTLRLTHSLGVSSNYASLKLKVLAELIAQDNAVLYRNYFHIQSKKLLKDNELLSDLNAKDREFADRVIVSMLEQVPPLVLSDLTRKSGNVKNSEIRFTNQMGNYFEMGEVLAANEGYITFRTLRGEIKHYPYTTIE